MAFNDTISTLSGTSTFYDWFIKENNEIISKLNQVTVSGVCGGDGILASTNLSSGLVTLSIGGTSGNITTGLTFSGKVAFLGETALPNVSYKITGITTGTPGFTFGSVVRITSSGYTTAKASDADSAEVVGVISARNPSYSVVTLSGKIEGDFTNVAGGTLSTGCVYFLDPTTSGNITATEPSTVGQVSKPVIIGLGQTAGMVVQYRGNYLNASSAGGESGTNRLYISFSTSGSSDPRSYGFSAGTFLSYAPDLVSGSTFFNQYLVDTGRTAINGWFLSGSKNYAYRLYDFGSEYLNLPWEEDYIVGMVENVSAVGSNAIYQIIARGTTPIIPGSVTAALSKQGAWCISGATFNPGNTYGQLVHYPTNTNNDPYAPVYQVGFVFSASPSSWYVNPRPLAKAPNTNYRSTQQAEELVNPDNYAFNGDFTVWQRKETGASSLYISTGNIYSADNWIRRMSGITGEVSIQRQSFTTNQTDVEGSPEYYVTLKALTDPSPNTAPTNSVYSFGHVIENSETFSNTPITVSFYARCTHINYSANVYLSKYTDDGAGTNTLVKKTIIGTIDFDDTSWNKHTINYTVPPHTGTTYSNDYLEIGIDLNPLINTAYNNSIAASTGIYVDIASFTIYSGTYLSPPHNFKSYNEKLKLAQKFYFRTYNNDQISGNTTMLDLFNPRLNTFSFVALPNTPWGLYSLPVEMRSTPSIAIRSPYFTTPSYDEMYNRTAQADLRNASGPNGRVAPPSGTPTVSTDADKSTVRINLNGGFIPFDVVYGHIVADASYPI
jgi:hypothetical protein